MGANYDEAYARRYRTRDDELDAVGSYQELVDWIGGVCDRFTHPIDVLDLGCGTGRYFWGLHNVKTLTGLDASQPMLAEAKTPTHADRIGAERIELVHGDWPRNSFPPAVSISSTRLASSLNTCR